MGIGGETVHQFTSFSTTGSPEYRVEGYDQAFQDGTSIEAAKAAVRKLLPPDAHSTTFFVVHGETGSCAIWNLTSKTVSRWFGTKKIGDTQGQVTMIFDALNRVGEPEFDSSNVTHAGVGIGSTRKGTNC